MIRYLVIILLLSSVTALSQPSDYIAVKKNGKTIRSYYAGTQIEMVTKAGAYRNALITKISNDSIYLREYLIRQVVTQFGFYVVDTAGSFSYVYNYQDIKSLGKKEKGFNVRGSGAALFGGGILLTVASGVVYLADRKKFSPALMGASAGLAGVGYLMSKAGNKGIVIGKNKYRLEYIKLTP